MGPFPWRGRLGVPHGGYSSARLERQVVALEVGGSSPLTHPSCVAGTEESVPASHRIVSCPRCPFTYDGNPTQHAPLAQPVEQRTLNPQVLGSIPRGRTIVSSFAVRKPLSCTGSPFGWFGDMRTLSSWTVRISCAFWSASLCACIAAPIRAAINSPAAVTAAGLLRFERGCEWVQD